MSDELEKRIRERRTRQEQQEAEEEAAQKAAQELAAALPGQWAKATTALHDAVTDANKMFTQMGEPHHEYNQQPQPRHPGEDCYKRVMIFFRDKRHTPHLSTTDVTVDHDGIIRVHHKKMEARTFELRSINRSDWDNLLADIYSAED